MQGKQDRIGVFRFLSEWYAQWQQVSAAEFERRRQQVFLGLSAQTQEIIALCEQHGNKLTKQ
jgi:hypothetical protein